MAKKSRESKNQIRYPSPILLLAAAFYLGYMAYRLWLTISDGSASGGSLVVSCIGFVAFILLAIGLAVLSIWFNKKNNEALDQQIAEEREALDDEFYNELENSHIDEDENNDKR